ncbi:MAG TPA: DEAD/DEAH box helicase [Thermomicrobiales bacterium]|nr:DEAD/DEAH box helicase [Thermomicrobiales bacterium]
MQIIHGTWIPDEAGEFVQPGAFYVWVETDHPPRDADGAHPRQLPRAALAAFLTEQAGLRERAPGALARALCAKYVLLPTAGDKPLPSVALAPYVEEETPLAYELAPWQVWCYPAPDVITTLNDLQFRALTAPDDFQLGPDLLFWQRHAQALRAIIARDQYIPALTYRTLAPAGGKRARQAPAFEILPGWEFVSAAYDAAIRAHAAAMPVVCRAGAHGPDGAALFDAEPLLRHFSECLLHDIVAGTPFTAKFDQRIAGTLLAGGVATALPAPPRPPAEALADYRHWLGWRARLAEAPADTGFTLCFRLEDAAPDAPDAWRLHFLVAARRDPSYKVSLAEYWPLDAAARATAARPFGADFEADFEKELLLALGAAARIYPTIWGGLATDRPTGCRLALDAAFAFLKESAWVLEDAGFTVIVPAWWTPEGRRRARIRLKTTATTTSGTAAGGPSRVGLDTLIAYQYQLSIAGQVVTEAEWRQLVDAKTPLVQFRGQWMELDRDKMQELLEFWRARGTEEATLTPLDLLRLEAEAADDLEWDHDGAVEELLARLQDKGAFAPIADPPALQGTLRDYQRRGVAWLTYMERLGLNPCLADDMGLGKTLQVIASLLLEREGTAAPPPTLIVAPTSVLGNWRKEIERFAPGLRALVHQGGTRARDERAFAAACREHDVVLTSFALARLDEKLLRGRRWHRVVVDEAQNIKNPHAAQTRAILKLDAPHRLALTGTPVENRLRDLWALFNFLNPGYLGKEAQFRKSFETPILKDHDPDRSATLKRLAEPFILRRVKTDKRIIADLPDKIEQKLYCPLTPEQASLYEAVVRDVAAELDDAEGIGRRGLILATLLRLKQICNHPAQFLQDGSAFTPERSHKLQRLAEMVEELLDNGESALIFTQFTEIGAALERHLARTRHYHTYYLHGGTAAARRDRMVAEFQDPETPPALFILSLRAGGVGLNLTKANHVFHFDRWWNPAVEDQATDRAFRIGQRKNVFAHKFVTLGTVEERIDAMIEDKQRLASLVVGADEAWLTELDDDTFKDLIALRRGAVLE